MPPATTIFHPPRRTAKRPGQLTDGWDRLGSVDGLAGGAARPKVVNSFGQDFFGLILRTTLFDIGQMGLVRQDMRRRRWIGGIGVRWQSTAWAVPFLRIVGADRESLPGFVPVGTEVRDINPRGGIAPLSFTHGARADTTTPDCAAYSHNCPAFFTLSLIIRTISPTTELPSKAGGGRRYTPARQGPRPR